MRAPLSRLTGLVLLLTWAGCGGPDGSNETARRNLLLVVVDTLRADRLGCYGHARDTSPTVDALAADGVLFERAISPAPWTKPAVASILTGLYPSVHGLINMRRKLPESLETLGEIASREGRATAAVVSHHLLSRKFRFDQGFERFVDVSGPNHNYVSSPKVTQAAIELLTELAADERPFVLFVHYFDPHYSYVPHPEVGFAPESAGRLRGRLRVTKLREMQPTPEEVAFVRDVYDEEIRFTDTAIGALLEALRERGLYDETPIVLTADHGEELHERGWFGHTRGLHEELVHVPLVVRDPDLAPEARGRRVREPVSTVALLPTLLELLGISYAPESYAHRSLAAVVRGEEGVPGELVYAEVDFVPAPRPGAAPIWLARKKAVIEGSRKLIRDERAGSVQLFDLEADPLEQHDLSHTRTEQTERLASQLDAFEAHPQQAHEAPAVELSPNEVEQLESLGYAVPSE